MTLRHTIVTAAGLLFLAMAVPSAQAAPGVSPGLNTSADSQVEHVHMKRHCWWHKGKRHCRYVSHRHRWGKGYGYRPGFGVYIGQSHRGIHRGHRHHHR